MPTPVRMRMRTTMRMRMRMVVATVVSVLIGIGIVEGFFPATIRRNHRVGTMVASTDFGRRRPWLAISSSKAASDNSNNSNSIGENDDEETKIICHQQIKDADPEWYREYVFDLLGEDYCRNRWPTIDLSSIVVLEEINDETEIEEMKEEDAAINNSETEIEEETTVTTDISATTSEESLIPPKSATLVEDVIDNESEEQDTIEAKDIGIAKEDGGLAVEFPETTEITNKAVTETEIEKLSLNEDEQEEETIEITNKEEIESDILSPNNDADEDEQGKSNHQIVIDELKPKAEKAETKQQEARLYNENDEKKTTLVEASIEQEEKEIVLETKGEKKINYANDNEQIDIEELKPKVEEAEEQEDAFNNKNDDEKIKLVESKIEQEEKEIIEEIKNVEEAIEEKGDPEAIPKSHDARVLVYRNIAGKTMDCVPLSNLLDLGYVISDLERIQAEFLSIVVLDQRKCPSMGMPPQWKIKNPKAMMEILFVDSMDEASAMAETINEEERQERDALTKRRRRQQGRKKEPSNNDQPLKRPTMTEDENRRNRRRSTSAETNRDGQPPLDAKRPRRRGPSDAKRKQGSSSSRREEPRRRRRRGESPEGEISPFSERRDRNKKQRRRREGIGPDGNPRKIYKVPRDDIRPTEPEPPDPNSPIWVNMDTFRDLLQKEAEFRMNFIGDDWSEVIEQENDWRTNLYKSWLWSLNNGVGDSIVPPSRYERARRNQSKRVPPTAPTRRNRPELQESRRRRPRDVEHPTRKSSPLRKKGNNPKSQPREQRRPKRVARDPVAEQDPPSR